MPALQGEFNNKTAARNAMTALADAGVSANRMRLWNILPPSPHAPIESNIASARGAVVGGLLGGAPGLVAGAAFGAALHSADDDEESLPDPTGVRLVVDTEPTDPDVAALLHTAGAVNVGPA